MPITLAPLQLAIDQANKGYPAEIQQEITIQKEQITKIKLSYQQQILVQGPIDMLTYNHTIISQLVAQKIISPKWEDNIKAAIREIL